jgi:hypothetical protein
MEDVELGLYVNVSNKWRSVVNLKAGHFTEGQESRRYS